MAERYSASGDPQLPIDLTAIRRLSGHLREKPSLVEDLKTRPTAELVGLGVLKVSSHVDVVDSADLSAHLATHPDLSTASFSSLVPAGGGVSPRAISI